MGIGRRRWARAHAVDSNADNPISRTEPLRGGEAQYLVLNPLQGSMLEIPRYLIPVFPSSRSPRGISCCGSELGRGRKGLKRVEEVKIA